MTPHEKKCEWLLGVAYKYDRPQLWATYELQCSSSHQGGYQHSPTVELPEPGTAIMLGAAVVIGVVVNKLRK